MSEKRNHAARTMWRLLEFVADVPASPEEAEAQLRREGVDVEASWQRALAGVARKKKEVRAALRQEVLSKVVPHQVGQPKRDYAGMVLSELRALVQFRNLAASYRNFDEMTEEDLRSLLEDADEYGDNGSKT